MKHRLFGPGLVRNRMSQKGVVGREFNIVHYLLVVGLLVVGVGVGVNYFFGATGITVLELAVSAILTAALVILYFRQTTILESQRDLLTQELNREARQQHTETLRERVQLWHGNPNRETSADPFDQPGLNLPAVADASFDSAPTGTYAIASADDEEFHVVPFQLQGDRYLQDLLWNHAPDLQERKEAIEALHDQFVGLRTEFIQTFEAGIVREVDGYRFEPADYFARWLFELLVMYERGLLPTFDDLRERVTSQLERGNTGQHPDEPRIWIRAELGGGSSRAIYSAVCESADREALREYKSTAKAETEGLLAELLDELEEQQPFEYVGEAAEVLDEAARVIEELQRLLVEYDGRPIYPGDCQYLEEARISDR